MRVLFVSSEIYPLAKTGGLADVAGALPPALAELDVEVRVLMPGYPEAMAAATRKRRVAALGNPLGAGEAHLVHARIPGSGLPVWLVDCPPLYDRPGGPYQDETGTDWPDNHLRFGLLGWVGARLAHQSGPLDWRPQVVHINDWQAGLVPAYLHDWGGARPGTVLTIHNLAYQGNFPASVLPSLALPWSMFAVDGLEYYGQVSFLKAAAFYADRLTTVSPTYAHEIQTPPFGCGFEGLMAARAGDLLGILNGADYAVWNPAEDRHLEHRFGAEDAEAGKALNKAALQRQLGLAESPSAPLFVVVSRLTEQKGMDLLLGVLPMLVEQGAQLALLGSGDRALEDHFRAAARDNPRQVGVHIGYSEPLAHRLQAGGDILLVPSRFEPCGLTQMYALRYGTIPVVRRTGGLADTVTDAGYDSLMSGTATGFLFEQPNAGHFRWCLERAMSLYRQPEQWRRLRRAAMKQDFGWRRSAQRYRDLYATLRPEGRAGIGRRRNHL